LSAARVFAVLARGAVRRPLLVVSIAAALGAAGTALAVGLTPSTAIDTFVEGSSPTYRATKSFYRSFGSEPVEVVVKGNLQRLLLSGDVERLLGLEGCLAGRLSGPSLVAGGGADGPCGQLAKTRAAKVVIGPATFINEAALEIDNDLQRREREAGRRAAAAERAVKQRALARGLSAAEASSLGKQAREVDVRTFEAEVAALAVRYGLSKAPSLGEPEFVSTVVFDPASKIPGTPKQRFAYLFPSREAALVSVRLKPSLDQRQTEAAIAEIKKAVAMPQWQLGDGESYRLTGEPAILDELSSSISHSILVLLVAAAMAMALALGLVFRGRPRLLPLCIALLCTAIVFGGLSLSGEGLSVAEVAVLPILIGLAVDYAIQLQSRAEEAIAKGGLDPADAMIAAAKSGGPALAAAAAASGGAMLVLELSPVPTVRGFAILLVIGLAVALLCAVTVGSAMVVLIRGKGVGAAVARDVSGGGGLLGSMGSLRASWRGAEQLVRENRLTRTLTKTALERVPSAPWLVLAIGAACAALGWGLASLTPVQTDITKLVPQSTPSLRNLATLERLSGVGGELDLMLTGKNVVKPSTIEWMRAYQSRMLERFGYREEGRGCGRAPLCPALSLPDLLSGGGGVGSAGAAGSTAAGSARPHELTAAEVNGFLESVPAYFSQEVISPDRREATLAFGLKLMPLAQQQRIIEAMRSALHPPRGVQATLVGLPVLAAAADAQVASASERTLQLLLGLAAVAFVLLIAFKGDVRRALVPLLPVVLASGWSALLLLIVQLPLNPMSATLGALVVAISTEFSVLISERCREELRDPQSKGRLDVDRALRAAYRGTGVAVAASAVTAIVGFGVLVLSDIAMLRDFGFVTLIDLTVSLLGVLLVLPATLTLAYRQQQGKRATTWASALGRRSGARDGISA
jgi:uncharacterized protein